MSECLTIKLRFHLAISIFELDFLTLFGIITIDETAHAHESLTKMEKLHITFIIILLKQGASIELFSKLRPTTDMLISHLILGRTPFVKHLQWLGAKFQIIEYVVILTKFLSDKS